MGMSGEQKIPECRSGVMLVGGRTGALTSGPSHLAEMDPPSLGLPGPGLELFFLFIDLGLLEGLWWWLCFPWGWEPPGTGAVPKEGVASQAGHFLPRSAPCAGRDPGADGKSARGTARSFPAFGLQGEGGTGRAGLGWDWGREPLFPSEGLFLGIQCSVCWRQG